MKALLATIPHAGEKIPEEADWLKDLDEICLMYDVDRYVDWLYEPALKKCSIPTVTAIYHRYVVDCNRWISEVDCDSVQGSDRPSGTHPTGLHWRITTARKPLFKKPLSQELHKKIIRKYYDPFFYKVSALYQELSDKVSTVYHLDLHSMPSRGTSIHRDPGQDRPDVVIGDNSKIKDRKKWTQQVAGSYRKEGFEVQIDFPYFGGAIVEKYDNPSAGRQALMIELNRSLYMDEKTKKLIPHKAEKLRQRLCRVIMDIYN